MRSSLRLIGLAIRYHWDAQRSNPANLFAATFGMVVNNLIVLWGLWAMLFDGKPDGRSLTIYFLSLNAMVTIAWGSLCFFVGGFRGLGEHVEQGSLEPMLATPRDPLLLAGISQSQAPALGDFLQGSINLAALFFLAPLPMAIRCIAFTLVSAVGFLGLFILTGSIPFFIARGGTLGQLLLECNLSLSFYPTGKIFTDRARFLLYLTPAAATGVFPIRAIESGDWQDAALAFLAAVGFLGFSVKVFRVGVRRFQSTSYVSIGSG